MKIQTLFIFLLLSISSLKEPPNKKTEYSGKMDGEGLTQKVDLSDGPAYFHIESTDITGDYRYARIHVTMDKTEDMYNNAEIIYTHKTDVREPTRDTALYVSESLKDQHQYLFVSQFNIDHLFHTKISCSLQKNCSFTAEFKKVSYIEVPRNGHYQHYMYKEFPFPYDKGPLVTDYFKVSRRPPSGKNKYLLVTVTGTNKADIDVSYARYDEKVGDKGVQYKKLENKIEPGRYQIFNEDEGKNDVDYYFVVKGVIGDSVRFDVRELDPDNFTDITPNDAGVFGHAGVPENPRDCFKIASPPGYDKFLTVNVLFFKGRGNVRYNGTIETPGDAETRLKFSVEIKTEGVIELEDCTQFCIIPSMDSLYYIQVNDVDNREKPHIFDYQFKGFIYTHILSEGSSAYFSYRDTENFDLEMSYNMKVNSGYAKMYFITCKNYPNCSFDSEEELKKTEDVKDWRRILGINLFHAHKNANISSPRIRPFHSLQKLMLVICEHGAGICEFEVSFHSEKDHLHLKENSAFYQYLKSEKRSEENSNDKFSVTTVGGGQIVLTLFNGNVAMKFGNQAAVVSDTIYANRRVIKLDKDSNEKELNIELLPIESSYYSIMYEEDFEEKHMETGLVTVERFSKPETRKVFIVHRMFNRDYSLSSDFVALNCEIKVSRPKRQADDRYPLQISSEYIQDVIGARTEVLSDLNEIKYTVDVIKYDSDEDCMIQMSFQEINYDLEGQFIELEKPLIIPENYLVKGVLVRQIPKYRFVFPQVPRGGSVIWDLKVFKNKTSTEVGFGLNPATWNQTTTEHQQIVVTKDDIEESKTCDPESSYCQLYLNIMAPSLKHILHRYGGIYFELMVRTEDKSPAMLRKNVVRYDFLIETQPHYFYLKVFKGEEITVVPNLARGSATVVARIVDAQDPEKGEGELEEKWFGKWFLPQLEGKYRSNVKVDYSGKIEVARSDCKNKECYLIIGIFGNTNIKKDGKAIFPLSMMYFREELKTYLPSDTYVIDSFLLENDLQFSEYTKNFIFLCRSDNTTEFQIDFISDIFRIEISIEDKPTDKVTYFPTQREKVISITSANFISIESDEAFSRNVFNIKVSCTNKDTEFNELYSLRVREVKKSLLIKAEDDHPSICEFDSTHMTFCYFAVNVRDVSDITYVTAHAFTEYGRNLVMDASLEPQHNIELDEGYLEHVNYTYKSEKEFSGKLEVDLSSYMADEKEKTVKVDNKYLVFRVKPETNGNVVFLTNVYQYKDEYKPNPTTRQLYNLKKNETVHLKTAKQYFNFRIVSVYGKGSIVNKDDVSEEYHLQGFHDTISISSEFEKGLLVNATSDLFIFFVEYAKTNLDSIYEFSEFGKSLKLLVDIDKDPIPLEFYSKVPEDYRLTPVGVSINIIGSTNITEKTAKEDKEFEIVTMLINSKLALGKKRDTSASSPTTKTKFGIYDRRIQTGYYAFSFEEMKEFKGKKGNDDTYIYLALKKSQSEKQEHEEIYAQINAIALDTNATYAPHDTYIHGVVPEKSSLSYSLERSNKEDHYYQIEVSLLSSLLDFAIHYPSKGLNNITDHLREKKLLGRTRYTLKANQTVHITFFTNKDYPGNYKSDLAHFTFRYVTGEKNRIPIYMADYTSFKPEIIGPRDKKTYGIELHRVFKNENGTKSWVDVDYIVSIRRKDDNKHMEAIAFDPAETGPVYKFNCPKSNTDDTFEISLTVSSEVFNELEREEGKTHFMFVYANVQDGLTKCIVPYNTKPHPKEEDTPGWFPPFDEEESSQDEEKESEGEKKPKPHDEEEGRHPQKEEEKDYEWEEEERKRKRKEEEKKKTNAKKNQLFIIIGSILMGIVAVIIIVLSVICGCKRRRGPEAILDMLENENQLLKDRSEKKLDAEIELKLEEEKKSEHEMEEKKEEEKKEGDNIVNQNNNENLLFGEAEQLS